MGVPPKPEKGKKLSAKDVDQVTKFLLVSVYEELSIRAHDCDYCEDIHEVLLLLKKSLKEYEINVHQLSATSS